MKAKTHILAGFDVASILQPDDMTGQFTGTKVVATLGPSCQDVDVLVSMLQTGLTGARVDLTWGPLEFHRKSLDNLQAAMSQVRRLCCTMVDTMGREIMIRRPVKLDNTGWPVHEQPIAIEKGQQITVTARPDVEASSEFLPITYAKLYSLVQPGDTLYVSRYLVSGTDTASAYLHVVDVVGQDILCESTNDAVLDGLLTIFHIERSDEGILNIQNDLPLLSAYDEQCLGMLSQSYDVDYLCLSHCRGGEDVEEARRFLDSVGMQKTRILAKVATKQALYNFSSILAKADGIVICRGGLGLDCAPEKIALVQKAVIQACNLIGKPAMITRVVDTMITAPRPTRAEATDVANAVLDGCDAILLGAETLRGKYPVLTVRTVTSICWQAEKVFDHHYHYEHLMETAVVESEALEAKRRTSKDASFDSNPDLQALIMLKHKHGISKMSTNSLQGAQLASAKYGVASCGASTVDLTSLVEDGSHQGAVPSYPKASHLSLHGQLLATARFGAVSCANSHADLTGLAEESSSSIHGGYGTPSPYHGITPYISKLESIASGAVRAADMVGARLLVVWTQSGRTAQILAKYRPAAPILTLVVPKLVTEGLTWRLEGKEVARHCCLIRGVLPMLAAPGESGDALLQESIQRAAQMGLVQPHDPVVCVQRLHNDFAVKIVSLNSLAAPQHGRMARMSNEDFFSDNSSMGLGTPQPKSGKGTCVFLAAPV